MSEIEYDIDTAKRILAEHGYVVSPRPIEWKEFTVLVTVKVQSRTYTHTDFKRFVEDTCVLDAPRLAIHAGKEILNTSTPKVKLYNEPRPNGDDTP